MNARIQIVALAVFASALVSQISAQELCLREHNSARASNGKGALTYDRKLESAAKKHNEWMVNNNCFSHQCNQEPQLGQRVTNAGYRWGGVAENIAANNNDCPSALKAWMNSSGHKANILGNYQSVGCAMNKCNNCDWKIYWTCVFGKPM